MLGVSLSFYSKWKDSRIKEKELKIKELQFEEDKRHQVSKETYQKLFEEKINFYRGLYDFVVKYHANLSLVGDKLYGVKGYDEIDEMDTSEEGISAQWLKEILSMLNTNKFLLSKEMDTVFLSLFKGYHKNKEALDSVILIWPFDDNITIDELKTDMYKTIYKEHNKTILDLLNLIEDEINKIKNQIGLY